MRKEVNDSFDAFVLHGGMEHFLLRFSGLSYTSLLVMNAGYVATS
jgi:hypothetical protein